MELEEQESGGKETKLRLSLADIKDDLADVSFPYFGNIPTPHFTHTDHGACSSAASR